MFQCDGCNQYILQNRFHCKLCEDYDLCKTCVESNTANEHEHEDFEVILADKEEEDCDEEKKEGQ